MDAHFDEREARAPEDRESDLFARLPGFLADAAARLPALAGRLSGRDPATISSRAALAALPVLRKDELMEMQTASPPFGGFVDVAAIRGSRVFMSPGPIWEPQAFGAESTAAARALHAAGLRAGHIVHNAFSHHMTPGAYMIDEGARKLGCVVFPAGTGNTDMQLQAAAVLRPHAYCGTPDFLKVLLDRATETGRDLSSFRLGLVSGGALFPSLRSEYADRGIRVLQCYATAEFGVIAYESAGPDGNPTPGMIVDEDLIVEIVRPGTGDPVPHGEVGEVVVTSFSPAYPLLRLATGDLSAVLPGVSPCGRTAPRIRGWLGRADQRTKVKGMFVDPRQVAEVVARHAAIARARLVVSRTDERDVMLLHVEPRDGAVPPLEAIAETLRDVTKLGGAVVLAPSGTLPNDGKVISDERDYAAG